MNIVELVSAVELTDITCIHLVADRRPDPDGGVAELLLEEEDGTVDMDVHAVHWGQAIEIWFRAAIETSNARLAAAFAIQYERQNADQIPDDVRQDFIERVAVMAVTPYIREAIQDLGTRLRVPAPLLPILRQGEFHLTVRNEPQGDPAV